MAKKSDSGPVAKSAEQIVAATLRTAGANLIMQAKAFGEAAAAQAETLNALAEMYEGSSPKREADPAKPVTKIAEATSSAAAVESAKKAAMAVIEKDKNRDRVNAIIVKHAGELKALAECPPDVLAKIEADCKLALAGSAAVEASLAADL